jgi:hypothetical protein
MKQFGEYLERARRFELLAAEEKDVLLKAELERQANALHQLAIVRAKELNIPFNAKP